jgi:hypothetical protein
VRCVRVAVEVEKGGPASETHPGFWVCVLCVWCAMTMAERSPSKLLSIPYGTGAGEVRTSPQ